MQLRYDLDCLEIPGYLKCDTCGSEWDFGLDGRYHEADCALKEEGFLPLVRLFGPNEVESSLRLGSSGKGGLVAATEILDGFPEVVAKLIA